MSAFVLLHADSAASLLTDDPIVPAADVARLTDTAALLRSAARLHDDATAASHAAFDEARQAGYDDGVAAGRADAQAALDAELVRLAAADAARAERQAADLGRLALEVVRRIAGDIGSAEIVAGLAARVASEVASDQPTVVHVHPDALAAVSERLTGYTHLTVEPDTTLAPTDCVLSTPLGRTHAGLDTQLALLAEAWDTRA